MSDDQDFDIIMRETNEFIGPENREKVAHEMTLMLLYLNSWVEKPFNARRAWKGYDFDDLNQLAEEGMISDSKGTKSIHLTEEGEKKAQDLFRKYGLL